MATSVQSVMLRLHQRISPTTKKGQRFQDNTYALSISAVATASAGAATSVTTSTAHGLSSGDQVFICNHLGNTAINNSSTVPNHTVTVTSTTAFTVPIAWAGSTSATGTVTGALVGSVDSARLTRQRMMDIYNESRFAFIQNLRLMMPKYAVCSELASCIRRVTDFTFVSGVASKPSGYIDNISLTDSTGDQICILPTSSKLRIDGLESATLRYVFEYGNSFKSESAGTIVTDATDYIFEYLGLSTWQLNHVTGVGITSASGASPIVVTATSHGLLSGDYVNIANVVTNTGANGNFFVKKLTASTFSLDDSTYVSGAGTGGLMLPYESIDERWHGVLIEIAAAIADDLGSGEVNNLAKKLIGKG